MQDVDAYLLRKGLSFRCYFEAERMAVLDDAHQVRLNYEAFFFAETADAERFRKDPVAYCGLVTDPVTKRRFRPTVHSPRSEHEEVLYFFETDIGRADFDAHPEKYLLPGWVM